MKLKYIVHFFISLFLLSMVFGSTANAVYIPAEVFSGQTEIEVVYTDGSTPFGMSVGDWVTVNIIIDDSAYSETSGNYTMYTTAYNSGNYGLSLSFSLTSTDFTEEDDNWGSTWPAVTIDYTDINDPIINVIDFESITDGYLISIGIDEIDGPITMKISAVPEPGTLTLLSLALLSLAGLKRRQS